MLDHCGPLNGVLPAEDDRQHRALGVNLVNRAESAGQKLFLFRAIALESRDVAAKCRDLGLGTLDAVVEPCHIALLLGEPTLRVLDLGEQRRLPPPGLRGFFTLLLELVLGLLQLALLGLHRVVTLGLGADRERGDRDDDGKQQPAAPVHIALRPRASQPPNAPSAAPAARRRRTAEAGRNSRLGNPTVRLISGSSFGAASRENTTSASSASVAPPSPWMRPCS